MKSGIPQWIMPTFWGLLIGIVAAPVVGFSAGWVVRTDTAQEQAEQMTEKALIAALTPVCVAQFQQQAHTERTTQLAALMDENVWERGDYVGEQGWATMPGTEQPHDQVADACALELIKIAEKNKAK